MWILFAALTVLLWGTSETIFKKVSTSDKDSILKLISYNGIILGTAGLIFMFITKTEITLDVILTYLPNALIFITSMFCTYAAMKFTKVSITSPLQNSSCAITTILCILVLHQQVEWYQALAVVAILIGLILISLNKDESLKEDTEEKQKCSRRVYLTGVAFALGYWMLDGIGSFMDDYLLTDTLSDDQLFIAYGIIYMCIGIICAIIYNVKNYIKEAKLKAAGQEVEKKKFSFDKYKLIGTLIETTGQFTYTKAYFLGDGALVSPFIASYCIVTMILSRIFLKEKLSKYQYILIAIILTSLIVLSWE